MKRLNSSGISTVLGAILAFVIVGILAIAIDVTIASSSKSQHHGATEFAALAALETYQETDDTNAAKLAAALTKAKEVVQLNIPFMAGYNFLEDTAVSQDDLLTTAAGGENGRVIPGNWHFVDPDCSTYSQSTLSPTCPCGPGGAGAWIDQPCFEQVGTVDQATAIRIRTQLRDSSQISTLFAKVLGQNTVNFTNVATASLIPRHGVFAVDISRSVYRDTHINYASDPVLGAEYAYYGGSTDCSSVDVTNPLGYYSHLLAAEAYKYGNPLIPTEGLADQRSDANPEPARHYVIGPPAGGSVPEFLCINENLGDSERNSALNPLGTESYFLDQVIPPEPLTTILDSIHLAFDEFSFRAVASDRVGFIGFDDDLITARLMPMSVPAYDLSTPTWGVSDFVDFYIATDSQIPYGGAAPYNSSPENAAINNKMRKFLVPRYFGIGKSGNLAAKTDLPFALAKAGRMLQLAPGAGRAQSFIVLFTDGRTNCYCTSGDPLCGDPDCSDTTTHFTESMLDVMEIAALYATDKVSLHVFLFGSSSGPHTLVKKKVIGDAADPDRCYTDQEARADGIDFVDPNGGAINDPSDIFYGPNELHNAASETNGYWVPIRPPCPDDETTCPTATYTKQECIDLSCNAFGAVNGDDGELVWTAPTGSYLAFLETQGHYVAPGRLLCDPEGRTQAAQAQDHIALIMSQNPFLLVESIDGS